MHHPEDNRNQIRELAQTLMDGGVLDELIQQKLDAFNTRWDELMARVSYAHSEEEGLMNATRSFSAGSCNFYDLINIPGGGNHLTHVLLRCSFLELM